MKTLVRVIENHKPIYCRDCKSQHSFERYSDGDIPTESGRVFMLRWKCKECSKTVIMSNPDYKPPNYEGGTE